MRASRIFLVEQNKDQVLLFYSTGDAHNVCFICDGQGETRTSLRFLSLYIQGIMIYDITAIEVQEMGPPILLPTICVILTLPIRTLYIWISTGRLCSAPRISNTRIPHECGVIFSMHESHEVALKPHRGQWCLLQNRHFLWKSVFTTHL